MPLLLSYQPSSLLFSITDMWRPCVRVIFNLYPLFKLSFLTGVGEQGTVGLVGLPPLGPEGSACWEAAASCPTEGGGAELVELRRGPAAPQPPSFVKSPAWAELAAACPTGGQSSSGGPVGGAGARGPRSHRPFPSRVPGQSSPRDDRGWTKLTRGWPPPLSLPLPPPLGGFTGSRLTQSFCDAPSF
jgi:hypothetical protein